MKKTVFGIISVAAMFCFAAHAEEKTDIEALTAILNASYGAEVTVEADAQKCTVIFPKVTIESEESQYTEPKNPDDEPQLETKTVKNVIPATTAQCAKVEDFDSHAQYQISHNAPRKFIAQLYNRLGLSFLKDIEIKSFSEELKIVPQLGFISQQKISLNDAVYTQKDETTGLKSEIGNLQKYELLQETSKEGDKLKFRLSTNMDMLNVVLPFFSMQIKSEKHISEVEYNLPQNKAFDYENMAQNMTNLLFTKSAAVGRGIKVGIDMFDFAITLDTDITNNTQREKDETISTFGTFLLANIDIAGNLIEKEKKPKSIEIKYALKDLPPETLEELGKIQQEKAERMEKAESFDDLMTAKNVSDEQFAELFDKLAEKAKLTANIETKFDNASVAADFVLQRKNGYLYGISKVKVTNLYNIFPKQKKCADKSDDSDKPECAPDFMFEGLKDFIDTSKDSSETVYKYTEEGVFKNDVKIGEPIELDFKKMQQEKQQKDKEYQEKQPEEKEQKEMSYDEIMELMETLKALDKSTPSDSSLLSPDWWWKKTTPQMVEATIKHGASVKERDEYGNTPLMFAAKENQNPEIIETLIKHGADVNARAEDGGTPLMWAAGYSQNPEVIETLIKHGANVKERAKDGFTPLMAAAVKNPNPEVIETIIKRGASVKERSEDGFTPLMFASMKNQNPEVIETLIKHGADVKEKNENGSTPLMAAALFNQNPEVLETLINNGADVKERAKNGKTPLMGAAEKNPNPEVIETLIKHGADAKAKDADGKTALDYAKENEHLYRTDAYWLLNDKTYE